MMGDFINYNFTDEQAVAYKELKERFYDDFEENGKRSFMLYRFLKARKFDVDKAETMLRNHLKFRQRLELDIIPDDYKPDEVSTTYVPVNFMGLDKDGDLIIFVHVGSLDLIGITKSIKRDVLVKYLGYVIELATDIIIDQSLKLGRTAGCTLIFDCDGLTFAQLTNKAVIELVADLFCKYEANHPELLKVQYTLNAPVFVTYIWNTLKWIFPIETLQKINISRKDKLQPELLTVIDSDMLPAYLGGTKTDPDGNPNCFTIIKRGKELPKHHYLKNFETSLCNQTDAEKYVLKSRSRITIVREVEILGSFLEWQFESEAHDIGFGLLFKSKENEDLEVMLPVTRVSAHLHREIGAFVCEKPGIYIIVLDNSFSWFRGKHIVMKSAVREPRQEMEANS